MQTCSRVIRLKKKTILFGLFFLVSLYPTLYYNSETIVLAVNGLHYPIVDSIAIAVTFFGSLWFYIFFLCILVICKKTIKEVLFAGFSFFNTCIVVQMLKHIIFGALPRPIDTIHPGNLHIVENFLHDHYNSFPSGHASTIFVVISVLCIFMIDKSIYLQIILLVFGSIVALSRVYLCMHFYHDVYAGACIGWLCTMLTYYFINKINLPDWTNMNVYQLLNLII